MRAMNVPNLTKSEIRRRMKHLTAQGYQVIIDTVKKVHGKELSVRTVNAYIYGEKVGKKKTPLQDSYQILPVFVQVTDAEMERTAQLMKETSKKLMA